MFPSASLLALAFAAVAYGQQVGTLTAENHPSLSYTECTKAPGSSTPSCTTSQKSVTLDSNWRWLHSTSGSTNCYTGNTWDASLCPDNKACAANCALDGADYTGTYGITTSGNSLTLRFVTKGPHSTNVGSRVYLLDSASAYKVFKLKNKEFTFDVDMSNLPCGLNGALYFSEMKADGGVSTTNKAGAKYGTGYCDAQCPHDLKFINGEANAEGWTASSTDTNAGNGKYGACCDEMDIWEANKISTAYTPHPCSTNGGPYRCSGIECGDGADRYKGVCDKDGCDFNSFRMGNKEFLGPGKTVDTNKKITVVTQFITSDGTANGALTEIRRIYVQDGKVIANSNSNIPGVTTSNSLTDKFCTEQKAAFGDQTHFSQLGGHKAMGDSMANGMVLVMSIWGDHAANMLWLDSDYPLDKDPSVPGVSRGTCPRTSGKPADLERDSPNASVTFSNIRFGDLDSTYTGSSNPPGSTVVPSSTSSTGTPPTPSAGGTVPRWGQCGGQGYTGPTACVSPYVCTVGNPWYSQCL
ncbi:hypothetical protein HGRIS_011534 [Hohenbuehelia grisea]|uniref:Glucanase n=1 Tax=Hohenbuehelia grisea TaxID=104357 RepID=A0ABR3JXM4_9AGAR